MSTDPGPIAAHTSPIRKVCRGLLILLCVGAFSLPGSFAGASVDNHGIVGTVVDNSGSPINNVQVAICHQDQSCSNPEVTRTNTAGSYFIGCCGDGEFVLVWANKDKVVAFWEEKQNVTIPPGINTRARADFQLPADLFTPVATLLLIFATVNTNQFEATLSWSMTTTVSTRVDAYGGGTGVSFSVTSGVTQSGSGSTHDDPTINAQIVQRGVVVHGIFWKTDPSHPVSVYVSAARDYYNIINTQADYMPNPPPTGGTQVFCPKKNTCAVSKNDAATFALRLEWQVSVTISVLGVGFSAKLASFLIEGSIGVERTMTISLKNLTSKTHAYIWYLEGDAILHVWQVS